MTASGGLEQVQDVLARVVELLVAQRARVPAREARALAQAHVEQVVQQRLVADLRAQAREPGGELRVEDVRDLGAPDAAQQRDVLAAGVHARSRPRGSASTSASGEQSRLSSSGSSTSTRLGPPVAVGDGDLDQAQQRAVAALAHELGVDRERAGLTGALGERGRDRRAAHSGFSSGQRPVRSNSSRAALLVVALLVAAHADAEERRSAARPTSAGADEQRAALVGGVRCADQREQDARDDDDQRSAARGARSAAPASAGGASGGAVRAAASSCGHRGVEQIARPGDQHVERRGLAGARQADRRGEHPAHLLAAIRRAPARSASVIAPSRLDEPLAAGAEQQRHVRVARRGEPEPPLQPELARRRVEQVGAADDLADALVARRRRRRRSCRRTRRRCAGSTKSSTTPLDRPAEPVDEALARAAGAHAQRRRAAGRLALGDLRGGQVAAGPGVGALGQVLVRRRRRVADLRAGAPAAVDEAVALAAARAPSS